MKAATPVAGTARSVAATVPDPEIPVLTIADLGILRQVSPIFDTKALGYSSALVAMQVAPERLARAAAVINAHPGVSHNYKRNHEFNMWFTVAMPPASAAVISPATQSTSRGPGGSSRAPGTAASSRTACNAKSATGTGQVVTPGATGSGLSSGSSSTSKRSTRSSSGTSTCLGVSPPRSTLRDGEAPCAALRPLVAGRAESFEIAAVPGWSQGCYADEVHPSPRGRALLLEAIKTALAR